MTFSTGDHSVPHDLSHLYVFRPLPVSTGIGRSCHGGKEFRVLASTFPHPLSK